MEKKNYLNFIRENKLNWVFVATQIIHFGIVKNCLNSGVNVFCEKPLTINYLDAKKLFKIAKRNKVKLYVSDVYSFHNKKIKKILLSNKIVRSKNNVKGDNEFFYRFMYHDISILFTYFKNFKIKSVNINRSIKNI